MKKGKKSQKSHGASAGLASFDSNHNGSIDGAEVEALRSASAALTALDTDKDGKRTLITRIGPGESIGEINLFDPGTASASVTAQSFSQVWKATRRDFEAFVQAYPEVGEHILVALVGELSRRIRFLNGKLIAMEVSYQELWR